MTFKHPNYEASWIQDWINGGWWEKKISKDLARGDLIRAFVPHVNQVPWTLRLTGRQESTSHGSATYKLEAMQVSSSNKPTKLPVAAMPCFSGEKHCVYKAKKRPALIISLGGKKVPKLINEKKSRWTTECNILIAPYYGNEQDGTRGGCVSEELRARIIRCEYPQFIIDKLPIPSAAEESVLKLDHAQPIGKHHDSIEPTGFCLTKNALDVFDEWFEWLLTGELNYEGFLFDYRELVMENDATR